MALPFIVNSRQSLKLIQFKNFISIQKRLLSNDEVIQRRNDIFNSEQKRQREMVGRIEKIEVRYLGTEDTTLIMNKNLSTPYNCAQHISESLCQNSALALVDNKFAWDMHRPLPESCTIQLLHFKMAEPQLVNKAFWRSCSYLLGAVLQKTFKEGAECVLHSFPSAQVKSGSFVHDISLNHTNWQPSEADFRTIGAELIKLASKDLKIERLEVNHDVALEIFKNNPFKREQLPNISNQNNGVVTLYRVGDHIDISRGPMVASTRFISKVNIASVHKVSAAKDSSSLYRVQGIALPIGFSMSHFAFNILMERAKKLNCARLPNEIFEDHHIDNNTAKVLRQN